MYGAILGDMIGAPYEFDRGNKSKDFVIFNDQVHFTDDTVMTIAVAEALMDAGDLSDQKKVKEMVIASMKKWGKKYPDAGYGNRFTAWLESPDPEPYNSWGNGSAMRVSSAGWLYNSLDDTRLAARLTAKVTHNHPEGIKGAEATAAAIWLARFGKSKNEIKDYIVREFGYDLSRNCDEIRPGYTHDESCQRTVPEAITAFMEGTDYEDVVRTAVSLGGDCDTLTCIAGGIGEAAFGVPELMKLQCRRRLPDDMLAVLDRFEFYPLKDREHISSVRFYEGLYTGEHTIVTIVKYDTEAAVIVEKGNLEKVDKTRKVISIEEWNKIVERLYSEVHFQDWNRSYIDMNHEKGTSCSLDVKFTGSRRCHYYGDNTTPPNWDKAKKIFGQFADL